MTVSLPTAELPAQHAPVPSSPAQRRPDAPGAPAPRRAPFPWLGLIVLAAAVFLSVTGETLPTGLLPDMSASLGVGEPEIGLLVTVFALTVVVSSAPLTALTARWSRHTMIVVVIAVLALSYLASAFAPSYGALVGLRVFGGVAHGMFWALVGAYAGHLVPKDQIGRAVSITLGGGTLAMIFGVPMATSFGHVFGWRMAFAVTAGLLLVGAALVWRFLPQVERERVPARPHEARPRHADVTLTPVLLVCALAAIVMVGHFALYTFVAAFLIDAMHVASAAVGPLLFVYGATGALGLVLSGSVLGRNPARGLVVLLAATGLGVAGLALFAGAPVAGFAAFALWGLAFGALPAMLQTRLLFVSSPAFRDTASALYTTAFNVGIGGGAALGAAVYASAGVARLPWIYLGVLLVAMALAAVSLGLRARR